MDVKTQVNALAGNTVTALALVALAAFALFGYAGCF